VPRRRILGRLSLGHQVLARQRLEREHDRRLSGVRCQRTGPRDQRAVPEMNAIETAHRDGSPPMMGLQALYSTYEFHRQALALLRMWRRRRPLANNIAK
jgi:hypothetical protein